MASTNSKPELPAEDVKALLTLAKKDAKARTMYVEARAAFVAELQAKRPPAAVRRELAAAAGLSHHRVDQLMRGTYTKAGA